MGFTDYLRVPEIGERYRKVKQYFFLRESAYDVTSQCQLRCEGCYFYAGGKDDFTDVRDPAAWKAFFEQEKARGITYVVLAGAEPALQPRVLRACYDVMPLGTIASNGLRKIDEEIGYRIHLSVWGDGSGDPRYRRFKNGKPGPYCLIKQLENYADDERVVFVYTFNNENADQLDDVLHRLEDVGRRLTFNVFSTPGDRSSPLELRDSLKYTRDRMLRAMDDYPDTCVYSHYNALVHTQVDSLDGLFGCVYPRAQYREGVRGIGLSETFRSYRTDFSHDPATDCCVPDTDCDDCRHYASGSAIVTARLNHHVASEVQFRAWLDYVDTYLAVWLTDYERGPDLCTPEQAVEAAARIGQSH